MQLTSKNLVPGTKYVISVVGMVNKSVAECTEQKDTSKVGAKIATSVQPKLSKLKKSKTPLTVPTPNVRK